MDRSFSCAAVVALLLLVGGSVSLADHAPAPTLHASTSGPGSGARSHPWVRSLPPAPQRGSPLDLLASHVAVVHPAFSPALTIIYPNGTISNLSAPISVAGNTYTITANFTGGLLIERNHTFLHGNGSTIRTGTNLTVGVIVDNATNVFVRNLSVQGGQEGFLVANSAVVHLDSDRVNGTTDWSVDLESVSSVSVVGSTLVSGEGILANHASGLNISGNTASSTSFFGILVEYVSEGLVANNRVTGSFGSILLADSTGLTASGNLASGGTYGIYLYSVAGGALHGNVLNGTSQALYLDSSSGIQGSADRGTNISYGIVLYDDYNVSFTNEQFPRASYEGLDSEYSVGITLAGSNLSGAGLRGALVDYSTNVTFQGVDVSGYGAYGVQANDSDLLNLNEVNASNSNHSTSYGFYLDSDLQTELTGCSGNATAYGLYAYQADGLTVTDSSFTGDLFYAYAALIESSHAVSVQGDNLSGATGDAFYGQSTSDLSVTGSDFVRAGAVALSIDSCSDVEIQGNDLTGALDESAGIWSSTDVVVSGNVGGESTQPYGVGFTVGSGADILVENNTARSTNISFELSGVSGLQVVGNNGSNSWIGFYTSGLTGASIVGNSFDNDHEAFEMWSTFASSVYHNDFINDSGWLNPASAQQIAWDHGYPGGGNYWGNWTGPDTLSGPGQNLTGSDGIVDRPLVINATNIDHYPLARPWTATTVAFSESGLAPGTTWSVRIAGTLVTGTSATLLYSVTNASNETLPYQVLTVSGYHAPSPAIGAVAFHDANATIVVTFNAFTYPVTFQESGLAPGTAWSMTFGATILLSASPDANITASNGTYPYLIANVTGYALTTPGGVLTIHSGGVQIGVQFVEIVHPTVFQNRTLYHNQTIYQNGTGGSGGGGGNHSTGGGGSGNPPGGTTAAKAGPAGYSAMVVYALVAALAAVAILAALGFALYARNRPRTPPPAAQPWSPPAAPSTGPTIPPSGAIGAAAAVVAAPAPSGAAGGAGVPDWRED